MTNIKNVFRNKRLVAAGPITALAMLGACASTGGEITPVSYSTLPLQESVDNNCNRVLVETIVAETANGETADVTTRMIGLGKDVDCVRTVSSAVTMARMATIAIEQQEQIRNNGGTVDMQTESNGLILLSNMIENQDERVRMAVTAVLNEVAGRTPQSVTQQLANYPECFPVQNTNTTAQSYVCLPPRYISKLNGPK